MIFVDTSVLIDVVRGDLEWQDRSAAALDLAISEGNLGINDIVYSELSIGYSTVEELDKAIEALRVRVVQMTNAALFLAARAYARYREHGGTRTGVLPDFFIGAQAATEGSPLLTRDPKRIRSYFPTVRLLSP